MLVAGVLALAADAGLRTWTSTDGRTMQAKLAGVEGADATFTLANGQAVKVPLARLSPTDQDFIKQSGSGAAPKTTADSAPATTPRTPIEKRVWPKEITVPPKSLDAKLVEEKPTERIYRYRSAAFEFISQDKLAGSVMNEVTRIFEGTRSLVDALPWGVHPEPPPDLGFFQAKLYVTEDAYHNDGGPLKSGGVYFSGDRIFRVPLKSMGLVMRGKTWFKDDKFSSDTLVHEITHQMMHDYLPFLPHWIAEGCAEYTNMLPYHAGTFRSGSHEQGIKEYIKKQLPFLNKGISDLGGPYVHMSMKPDVWAAKFQTGYESQHRIYGYSCLLVYYFCHLDGDGKGTRFLKFFDALAVENDKWRGYRMQFADYRKQMDEFFKQPGVKKLENGRFTYPKTLTPPKRPEAPSEKDPAAIGLDQMETILMDGRTPEKLEEDVKAGFKKIGVKW